MIYYSCYFAPTQRGEIQIGKINVLLIGVLIVILVGLIIKGEEREDASSASMRFQNQVSAVAAPEVSAETTHELTQAVAEPTTPSAPEEVPAKKGINKTDHSTYKKNAAPAASAEQAHSSTVVAQHDHAVTDSAPPAASEESLQKDPSKRMIVFNIWSVSELRLRSAYASYMNDSAVPAAQLDARKKEYLSFVSHRTKKCGELDSKFASNINTVEKLTLGKGDADMLQCHTIENNIEIDRLHHAMQ
jgi:hypothetical protein